MNLKREGELSVPRNGVDPLPLRAIILLDALMASAKDDPDDPQDEAEGVAGYVYLK